MKDKSVVTKNYLLSKYSILKSKLQNIDNKKKKCLYAGLIVFVFGAIYFAYKKYKNQNNELTVEIKLEPEEEELFNNMINNTFVNDHYSILNDSKLISDRSFRYKFANHIDTFIGVNLKKLNHDQLIKLWNMKNTCLYYKKY